MKMKISFSFAIVTAVLVTAEVNSTDVTPKNEAEKQILLFFGRWRRGGTLPFSLPPLDVIKIPPLNGSYSGKGVKLIYSSSEMQLDGLNNFSVVELSVSLPEMRASGSLSLPSLTVTAGSYELKGKAYYVYTLKGSGKLNVTLNEIQVQFGIRLARSGNGTKVTEMHLDFVIDDIKANLENSSWPINKLLNKEGVKILNGYHEEIITATRDDLVWRFDQYLAAVTPVELLNKIRAR